MVGRVLVGWILGALILGSLPALAAAPAALEATLETPEPLRIDGDVRFVTHPTPHSFRLMIPASQGPTEVLKVAGGLLDIYERSFRVVDASDYALTVEAPVHFESHGKATSISPGGPWRIRMFGEYELRDASIVFQQRQRDGFLGGGKQDHPATARLGAGAACEVAAPLQDTPAPLEPQAVAREQGAVDDLLELLGVQWHRSVYVGRLDCRAHEFRLGGATHLAAWGGTVWANFTDARTNVAQNLRIETGTFFSVNESMPHVIDRTDRWVYVNMTRQPQSTMEIAIGSDAPLRIEASTAHAFGVGRLQTPASMGQMKWGDTTINGTVPPTSAEGAFQFNVAKVRTVRIMGLTRDAAPTSWTTAGSRVDQGYAWVLPSVAIGAVALLTVGGSLLYTRLTKASALNHPRRQTVVEYLTANPGARLKEIAQDLGWSRAVIRHHLEHLEQHGVIVVRRYGRRTAAFVVGATPPAQHEALALARSGAFNEVLKAIAMRPGATQRDLCEKTGLSQPYVSQLLQGLTRDRLVRVRTDGPCRTYELASDTVRSVL